MSILVDDREGSVGLAVGLREHGLDVLVTRMECADVAFIGSGPGGEPLAVGVEVKTANELLDMITRNRFAGVQLPCLHETYKERVLAVVGHFRPGRGGELLINGRAPAGWKREWKYRDVDHWLMTQQIRGGMRLMRADNEHELLQQIHDMYTWWTVEGWEGHTSHVSLFESLPTTIIRPTFERRVYATFPGIGIEKSARVADWFKSVRSGVCKAGVAGWMSIPGVGKKIAEDIEKALRGRE